MKSPRILRPHSFTLLHNKGEDENGSAIIEEINVQRVRIDINYGMKQSQKGISTDDKVLITLDMNDYVANEIPCGAIELKKDQEVIINKDTYTINTIHNKNSLNNGFFFCEVTAK